MRRSWWKISMRALAFAAGSVGIGIVAARLGFRGPEIPVIAALGGLLSLLSTHMPWGGWLFPFDSLLLCMGLLTGRWLVAGAGIAAGIAAASMDRHWLRTLGVAALRNCVAVAGAIAVWRNLAPAWVVIVDSQGRRLALPGGVPSDWLLSAAAVPALILTALSFVVLASSVESLLRPNRRVAFGEFWLENFGRNFHHVFFTVLLGAIAAVAYRDVGLPALVVFAFPIVLSRDALKRNLDLRGSRLEALKALSSSVDARDRYTYDHSNRVSRLASLLAREMGFPESTVETIESGALLHDIGKLAVDAEILSKPGPLNREERLAIERHPIRSADVVSRVDLLKDSVGIVKHHHERPDGTGYPDHIAGHQIPVGARILNVADAFDAMISDRPYRRARTLDEALRELQQGAGTEFDPVVVEYLTRLVSRGRLQALGFDIS
jgi:putative nucleotidyltransferase with HDIG domain